MRREGQAQPPGGAGQKGSATSLPCGAFTCSARGVAALDACQWSMHIVLWNSPACEVPEHQSRPGKSCGG